MALVVIDATASPATGQGRAAQPVVVVSLEGAVAQVEAATGAVEHEALEGAVVLSLPLAGAVAHEALAGAVVQVEMLMGVAA